MKQNQNLLIAQVVKFLNEQGGCLVWRQENNGRIDEPFLVENLSKLFWGYKDSPVTDEIIRKHIKTVVSKSYRGVPNSLLGVSDVIGFHLETGRWIAVEIKCGNDELRDEQRAFLKAVRRSGGDAWLVRDINSFRSAYFERNLGAAAA